MSAPTAYAIYATNDVKSPPIIERTILIKGGANVAEHKTLITPKGVVTEVSDEDFAILENDYHFKDHVKNGYLTVERKETPIAKVIEGMKEKDASAPKTPDDEEFLGSATVELNKPGNKKGKGK
jgi:hypothetical protein